MKGAGKGVVHVLLGGIGAAAAAALTFAFARSFISSADARQSLWGLAVLALFVVPLIVAAATMSSVRPLEAAAARYLLDLELPDVLAPSAWASRRRGAVWLGLNLVVGGVALFGLVFLLPLAMGLILFPFGQSPDLRVPGLQTWSIGTGPATLWLWVVAIVLAACAAAVVLAGSATLRYCAPTLLGPTDADRLLLLRRHEREMAAHNALARELHDSIGHALTAITVQAEAGALVIGSDPDFARSALTAIGATGRRALDELDSVLGALRRGENRVDRTRTIDDIPTAIDELATPVDYRLDGNIGSVAHAVSCEVFSIVIESLTNAVRYGISTATAVVTISDGVTVLVRNASPPASTSDRVGRGILGMRERTLLLGGTLEAGCIADVWVVRASLPLAQGVTS